MIYVYFLFYVCIASFAETLEIADVLNKGNDTNGGTSLFATNILGNNSIGIDKIVPNGKTFADNVLLNHAASNNGTINSLLNTAKKIGFATNNIIKSNGIIAPNDIIAPNGTTAFFKKLYDPIASLKKPQNTSALFDRLQLFNIKNANKTFAFSGNATDMFPMGRILKSIPITLLPFLWGGLSLLGLGWSLFGHGILQLGIIFGGKLLLAFIMGKHLIG